MYMRAYLIEASLMRSFLYQRKMFPADCKIEFSVA